MGVLGGVASVGVLGGGKCGVLGGGKCEGVRRWRSMCGGVKKWQVDKRHTYGRDSDNAITHKG